MFANSRADGISSIFLAMLLCLGSISHVRCTKPEEAVQADRTWEGDGRPDADQDVVYALDEPLESNRDVTSSNEKSQNVLEQTKTNQEGGPKGSTHLASIIRDATRSQPEVEDLQESSESMLNLTHHRAASTTRGPRRKQDAANRKSTNYKAKTSSPRNLLRLSMVNPKLSRKKHPLANLFSKSATTTSKQPPEATNKSTPTIVHSEDDEILATINNNVAEHLALPPSHFLGNSRAVAGPSQLPYIRHWPQSAQTTVVAHPHQLSSLMAERNGNVALRPFNDNFGLFPSQQIAPFTQHYFDRGAAVMQPNLGDPFDQAAAQSMETYRHIRSGVDQLLPSQRPDELSLHFTSSAEYSPLEKIARSSNINDLRHANLDNTPVQNASMPGGQQLPAMNPGENSSETATAIATAVLAERTKNIFGQLNQAGFGLASPGGGRVTRDSFNQASSNRNVNFNAAASKNPAIASMLNSAAKAWASATNGNNNYLVNRNTKVQQSAAMPAIVVENDGPTVTTVDFTRRFPFLQQQVTSESPEEDEESAFFSEENEEVEGSSLAKQLAKLRPPSQRHPFANQADPSTLDFFESPAEHAARQPLSAPNRVPENFIHEFMRPQDRRPDGITPSLDSQIPDSINAIKELSSQGGDERKRERDLASDMRDRLATSNNEQIDQLIKQLQEMNKQKQRHHWRRKKANSLKEGEDDDDSFDDDSKLDQLEDQQQEDDQIRLLRDKLLARLRTKGSRKKTDGPNESAPSSLSNDAIKIPLHTLLLAALDRRSGPSEQGGAPMIQDLIGDDRNRETIAIGQQDFHDVTNDLGSLMKHSHLYESLASTPSPKFEFAGHNASEMLEAEIFNYEPLQSTKNITKSDSEKSNSNEDDTSQGGVKGGEQEAATTRVPVASSRSFKSSKRARESNKGRRDVSDDSGEDDFDVEKQIEKFSSDKNEPSLEPSWSDNKVKRSRSRKKPHVDFDDDYDQMGRSTREKILKRRRRPPPTDEAVYEDQESKFFDQVQRDTSSKIDIDKDIANMKEPDGVSRNEQQQRRGPARRRQNQNEEYNDDSDDEDQKGAKHGEDRSSDGPGDDQNRKSAASMESLKTWKPSAIDDEVRRIEDDARRKQHRQTKVESEDNNSRYGDDQKEDDSRHEDTAESRSHRSTVRPEKGGEIIKVIINTLPAEEEALHASG